MRLFTDESSEKTLDEIHEIVCTQSIECPSNYACLQSRCWKCASYKKPCLNQPCCGTMICTPDDGTGMPKCLENKVNQPKGARCRLVEAFCAPPLVCWKGLCADKCLGYYDECPVDGAQCCDGMECKKIVEKAYASFCVPSKKNLCSIPNQYCDDAKKCCQGYCFKSVCRDCAIAFMSCKRIGCCEGLECVDNFLANDKICIPINQCQSEYRSCRNDGECCSGLVCIVSEEHGKFCQRSDHCLPLEFGPCIGDANCCSPGRCSAEGKCERVECIQENMPCLPDDCCVSLYCEPSTKTCKLNPNIESERKASLVKYDDKKRTWPKVDLVMDNKYIAPTDTVSRRRKKLAMMNRTQVTKVQVNSTENGSLAVPRGSKKSSKEKIFFTSCNAKSKRIAKRSIHKLKTQTLICMKKYEVCKFGKDFLRCCNELSCQYCVDCKMWQCKDLQQEKDIWQKKRKGNNVVLIERSQTKLHMECLRENTVCSFETNSESKCCTGLVCLPEKSLTWKCMDPHKSTTPLAKDLPIGRTCTHNEECQSQQCIANICTRIGFIAECSILGQECNSRDCCLGYTCLDKRGRRECYKNHGNKCEFSEECEFECRRGICVDK